MVFCSIRGFRRGREFKNEPCQCFGGLTTLTPGTEKAQVPACDYLGQWPYYCRRLASPACMLVSSTAASHIQWLVTEGAISTTGPTHRTTIGEELAILASQRAAWPPIVRSPVLIETRTIYISITRCLILYMLRQLHSPVTFLGRIGMLMNLGCFRHCLPATSLPV